MQDATVVQEFQQWKANQQTGNDVRAHARIPSYHAHTCNTPHAHITCTATLAQHVHTHMHSLLRSSTELKHLSALCGRCFCVALYWYIERAAVCVALAPGLTGER